MQRKLSKLFLLSSGAALAWFLDPVSGAERRRQLAEQMSGLTGQIRPPSDPTGGAVPATSAAAPPPVSPPSPDDPTLLQAVEAASTGEKVLRGPGEASDGGDTNRATLRTTW